VQRTGDCSRCPWSGAQGFLRSKLSRVQFLALILAPFSLVICLSAAERQAGPSSTQARHPTEGQSVRNVPNGLTVQPAPITLGPDETYQFGIADAQGTAIPLHWSLPKPGCSESNCGIVYDNGLFRAPHLFRKEQVVFLIGVPIAEPRLYVIRAQVHLVRRTTALSTTLTRLPPNTRKTPLSASTESGGGSSPGATSAPSRAPLSQASRAEPMPIVTYDGGLLAINAEDATLATVLRLVAEKTGAAISVPPGTGNERIVEHAGPGEPRDILRDFLNGSPFGFIIVNSPDQPHELQQVLLFVKDRSGDSQSISAGQTNASAQIPDPTDSQNQALRVAAGPDLMTSGLPTQSGSVSPEVIQKMMRDKGREIRERALRQGGQPQ
jgi:hypothetical protein